MVGSTGATDDPFRASGSFVTRYWKKLAQKTGKIFLCIAIRCVDRDVIDKTILLADLSLQFLTTKSLTHSEPVRASS